MNTVLNVKLEPFHPDRHREQLWKWLSSPHVVRWWGEPEAQLAISLLRPNTGDHALITADNFPVGYLRWQRVELPVLQEIGLHDIPEGAVDLDILIGEPQFLGLSIGPRALQLLLDRLRWDPSIPLVGMTTSVENHSAIRADRKAGFRPLREYQDPEYGPCWVMVVDIRCSA